MTDFGIGGTVTELERGPGPGYVFRGPVIAENGYPNQASLESSVTTLEETKQLNQAVEDSKSTALPSKLQNSHQLLKPTIQKIVTDFRDADRKLFVDKEFADVTFLIEGVEISAHRCILLTRCPSFGNMFTSRSSLVSLPLSLT